MDDPTEKRPQQIEAAKQALEQLEVLKVDEITPYQDDGKRRPLLVWKVDAFIYATLARLIDLGEISIELWQHEKITSTFLHARAMIETIACLHAFVEGLATKVEVSDLKEIDEYVKQYTFGQRLGENYPQAINVLTLIGHLEKLQPGFRTTYDRLSEVCHPNYWGNIGGYTQLSDSEYIVRFKPDKVIISFMDSEMPVALTGSLLLMRIVLSNYSEVRSKLFELADRE
ncbi:MAG: hypothetical protein RIN56_03135 [Sporomusaceae bacterium]|nr:hypothetical protein [Sporomusaceae bacterium]